MRRYVTIPLEEPSRAADHEGVGVPFALNRYARRVVTMCHRVDNGLIQRDRRILRFLRETPVRIPPSVGFEEPGPLKEGPQIADLFRNGTRKGPIKSRQTTCLPVV